ncbi:hypothetical protein OAS39_02810 [Pirellulales bacterium]|nr:hypothetical protein [Pirellulales bacterium]
MTSTDVNSIRAACIDAMLARRLQIEWLATADHPQSEAYVVSYVVDVGDLGTHSVQTVRKRRQVIGGTKGETA